MIFTDFNSSKPQPMKHLVRLPLLIIALVVTTGIFIILFLMLFASVIWYFRLPGENQSERWENTIEILFGDCYEVMTAASDKFSFVSTKKKRKYFFENNIPIIYYKNWFCWALDKGVQQFL